MAQYRPVTDDELDAAIEYAKEEYGIHCLDRDLLRELADKALNQYHQTPRTPFPFTAAKVVRGKLRARTKEEDDKVQAFKGAISKIGNARAQWKRTQGHPSLATTSSSPEEYPEDPQQVNQFMLL